jgi:hypothetical protein
MILIGALSLAGCVETSDLALKQKCATYLKEFEKKASEPCINNSFNGLQACGVKFVSYSKKRGSCVGKADQTIFLNDKNEKPFYYVKYYDLLTGEGLDGYNTRLSTEDSSYIMGLISNYETSLELIK